MDIIEIKKRIKVDGKPYRKNNERQYTISKYEIEKGELILLGSKKRNTLNLSKVLSETPNVIGVFDETLIKDGNLKWLVMKKPSYRLFGTSKYEGISCRRVEPIQTPYFDIGHVCELVIGLDRVVETVESDENLKIHLEWIRKLKKPFELPKSKTYRACVIE